MELTKINGPFNLCHLIDYIPNEINTKVVFKNDGLLGVLKALDAGTELETHAAPGNAVFTVLEGIATVVIDGTQYDVSTHESMYFPKGVVHSVYAPQRLKFALVVDMA